MGRKYEQLEDSELFHLLKEEKSIAEKAFSELYSRYATGIYAFCRRFLGNIEEAQDIFQETFMKFHQRAKQLDKTTNVRGFLYVIARNLCINHTRTHKYSVVYEDYMNVKFENRMESDEILNLIKSSIELLPDDLKEAFILKEYNGMSYKDIAEITNSNYNTVRIRLFRAKKKLRSILAPYFADYNKT